MKKRIQKGLLKGISLNVLLLSITSLLNDISGEMIAPLLPLFIVAIGGAGIGIGLIGGIEESFSVLLKFFSGYFSDRFGKRRLIVFSGYSLTAISRLFLPFAGIWQQVLAIRAFDRFGKGVRGAPRDAIIADSAGEKQRGKAFGFHRLFDTSGAIIGSALALLFFLFLGINFQGIFLIAALVAFLSLIPLIFVRDRKKARKKFSLKIGLKGLSGKFKVYLLVVGVFAFASFSYMFFILRAQEILGTSLESTLLMVLSLYVLFNIVYALFSLPAGILSDRIGRKRTIMIGYGFYIAASAGFAFFSNIILVIVLFALYGLFNAFTDAIQRAFASDLSKKEALGTGMGAFYTAIGVAALPANIIAGAIWQFYGAQILFIYGAAVAFIALCMFALLIKEKK
ncbi:MAG: MFS transporter [Candidatus Diapherotrites archaeon]|nr:MFS transporter [Candidatus Diapherotrites archaeon]